MTIFYTGYCLARGGKQVILRASSKDPQGSSFAQPGTNITIEGNGLSRFEDIDFRDPYVFFNEEENKYWMLVATRLSNGPHWTRGCIALLTSTDLDRWVVEPEPLYSPNDMLCPECPELFTLGNGKWYLVYSRFHAPNEGTVYRVADSPRGPFRMPRDGSHGRLDGRRWYAAKSCPKAGDPSKRIFFGWIGDYVDEEGKWLWGGDMGLPREVSADSHGHLSISLPQEVQEHISRTYQPVSRAEKLEDLHLTSLGATATIWPDLSCGMRDLYIRFDIKTCDAHSFGMLLHPSGDGKAHKLQISPSAKGDYTVSLFTDFPPLDDFWADQYKLYVPRPVDGPELVRHESLDLSTGITVLIKGQTVQVLCGGRSLCFRLPTPAATPVASFGWFVEDGTIELTNLDVRLSSNKSRI
jgi:beta-fructofuranosidase